MPKAISDLSAYTLLTSNPDKIGEFSRFGLWSLNYAKGEDIEEVDGTPDEVIVYKAMEAGPMCIVEDSVVSIEGIPVVDIRWRLAGLEAMLGKPVDFEVRLGLNDGASIHVFKGVTSGRLVRPRGAGGFGFDPFFEVEHTGMTLSELAAEGFKDRYSPRLAAVRRLLSWDADFTSDIGTVPAWDGPMQGHP